MPAIRERKKGRAKGGIIITINKSLQEVRIREINYQAVEIKLTHKGNKWRIITVYSQDVGYTMETIMERIQEEKEEHLVIGGDYNARTGNEGRSVREEEERDRETRKSRDNEQRRKDISKQNRRKRLDDSERKL